MYALFTEGCQNEQKRTDGHNGSEALKIDLCAVSSRNLRYFAFYESKWLIYEAFFDRRKFLDDTVFRYLLL